MKKLTLLAILLVSPVVARLFPNSESINYNYLRDKLFYTDIVYFRYAFPFFKVTLTFPHCYQGNLPTSSILFPIKISFICYPCCCYGITLTVAMIPLLLP